MAQMAQAMAWIDGRREAMIERVAAWAAINSGSLNTAGLRALSQQVTDAAGVLDGRAETIALPEHETVDDHGRCVRHPLGPMLVIRKRPEAPVCVLLVIHLDTVYGPDHAFQKPEQVDAHTLRGPGVADAKGGVVVLLTALEALERSGIAEGIGWTVVLNPDEELGSPGSGPLLIEAAGRHDVGLVFEPTLPDGQLIGARKGSGNYAMVIRGRSAHVGRAFEQGRNAIHALAEVICGLERLNHTIPGATVNVGRVSGGGPVNVVPDVAVCRFNVRVQEVDDQFDAEAAIQELAAAVNKREGFEAKVYGRFGAPPKPVDAGSLAVLQQLRHVGHDLGLSLRWRSSGGVCDGNRLAAAGLPTVDTLGPRGGAIHSDQEYLLLDSLTERAKLTALLLLRYASGELAPPPRCA